jgi:hypothetical protein
MASSSNSRDQYVPFLFDSKRAQQVITGMIAAVFYAPELQYVLSRAFDNALGNVKRVNFVGMKAYVTQLISIANRVKVEYNSVIRAVRGIAEGQIIDSEQTAYLQPSIEAVYAAMRTVPLSTDTERAKEKTIRLLQEHFSQTAGLMLNFGIEHNNVPLSSYLEAGLAVIAPPGYIPRVQAREELANVANSLFALAIDQAVTFGNGRTKENTLRLWKSLVDPLMHDQVDRFVAVAQEVAENLAEGYFGDEQTLSDLYKNVKSGVNVARAVSNSGDESGLSASERKLIGHVANLVDATNALASALLFIQGQEMSDKVAELQIPLQSLSGDYFVFCSLLARERPREESINLYRLISGAN